LHTLPQPLDARLGIEGALQVIGHSRKGTQQLLAFGRDLLLCQAPLPLAKVLDLGLQAQRPIAPHIQAFLSCFRLDTCFLYFYILSADVCSG
jgi:hypothetical protein